MNQYRFGPIRLATILDCRQKKTDQNTREQNRKKKEQKKKQSDLILVFLFVYIRLLFAFLSLNAAYQNKLNIILSSRECDFKYKQLLFIPFLFHCFYMRNIRNVHSHSMIKYTFYDNTMNGWFFFFIYVYRFLYSTFDSLDVTVF